MYTPSQAEIQNKKTTGHKLCLWEVSAEICNKLEDFEDGFRYSPGSGCSVMFQDGLKRICVVFRKFRKDTIKRRTIRNSLATIEGRAAKIKEVEMLEGIAKPEEWYAKPVDDVFKKRCPGLQRYGQSIHVLVEAYSLIDPDFLWRIYRFMKVPDGFVENLDNYVQWFKDFEIHCNCFNKQDWVEMARAERLRQAIQDFHGSTMLCRHFDGNSFNVIKHFGKLIHGWTFSPLETPRKKYGTLQDLELHTEILLDIMAKESITHPRDFYEKGCSELFLNYGLGHLVFRVYPSWIHFLTTVYQQIMPEWTFDIYQFKHVPHGWWSRLDNRKHFLLYCERREGLRSYEDWKNVALKDVFQRNGGRGFLYYYDNSAFEAFEDCYEALHPGLKVVRSDFRLPNGFFDSIRNKIDEVSRVEKQNGFKDWTGWYLYGCKSFIKDNNLDSLCSNQYGGSIPRMLIEIYKHKDPSVVFDPNLFDKSDSYGERTVSRILRELRIDFEREWNHPENPCVHIAKCPFDFYCMDHSILIEYQGLQHYEKVNWSGRMTEEELEERLLSQQARDQCKREYAKAHGYTLVEIKYSQDRQEIEKLLRSLFRDTIPIATTEPRFI